MTSGDQNEPPPNQPDRPPDHPPTRSGPLNQELIPPSIDSVLRTAGVDTQDPNVTRALEVMLFSGSLPLPPPSVLSEYERHFPGLVERLVGWTDTQRIHRQSLERLRTEGSENRMNRSQLIAGGIGALGLVCSTIAGVIGNPWVAGVIAMVSIGGPTAAIILAKNTGRTPNPSPAPKLPVPSSVSPEKKPSTD